LLVTVNNRLKFEIEIVHDLLCHPIFLHHVRSSVFSQLFSIMAVIDENV